MPGGRPALFDTAEALEQKIEEYFEMCTPSQFNENPPDTVTISGLAYYLGFESRQSFYDYEKHDQFSYIIKRARFKVESEYEKRLQSKNPTGSIFALKNMGWRDKQELDMTTQGEKIGFNGIQVIKPDDPNKEVQA